jgi:hypothetical protein
MLRKSEKKTCYLNVGAFYVEEVRAKVSFLHVEPFYVKEGRPKVPLS